LLPLGNDVHDAGIFPEMPHHKSRLQEMPLQLFEFITKNRRAIRKD